MDIALTPDQRRWLEVKVAAGKVVSLEEALQHAVDGLITFEDDDLAWVGPMLENAEAQLARGQGIPAEQAIAEWREHARKLRRGR